MKIIDRLTLVDAKIGEFAHTIKTNILSLAESVTSRLFFRRKSFTVLLAFALGLSGCNFAGKINVNWEGESTVSTHTPVPIDTPIKTPTPSNTLTPQVQETPTATLASTYLIYYANLYSRGTYLDSVGTISFPSDAAPVCDLVPVTFSSGAFGNLVWNGVDGWKKPEVEFIEPGKLVRFFIPQSDQFKILREVILSANLADILAGYQILIPQDNNLLGVLDNPTNNQDFVVVDTVDGLQIQPLDNLIKYQTEGIGTSLGDKLMGLFCIAYVAGKPVIMVNVNPIVEAETGNGIEGVTGVEDLSYVNVVVTHEQ
jgi:hypothetical protein